MLLWMSSSMRYRGHLGRPLTWLQQMPLIRLVIAIASSNTMAPLFLGCHGFSLHHSSHGLKKCHGPIIPWMSRLLPTSQISISWANTRALGVLRWLKWLLPSSIAMALRKTMTPSSVGNCGNLGRPLPWL